MAPTLPSTLSVATKSKKKKWTRELLTKMFLFLLKLFIKELTWSFLIHQVDPGGRETEDSFQIAQQDTIHAIPVSPEQSPNCPNERKILSKGKTCLSM